MPEFFVKYLGRIPLEFKSPPFTVPVRSSNLRTKIPPDFVVYFELLSSTNNYIELLPNIIYYLLQLKDYSSCITIYQKSMTNNAIVSYNISLSCIYTGQYELGLSILDNNNKDQPECLLLKVYLNYLLKNHTIAIELYAQYKKIFKARSKSISVATLNNSNAFRVQQPSNISGKKPIYHRKTPSSLAAHLTPLNLPQKATSTKIIKPILQTSTKILKPVLKIRSNGIKKRTIKANGFTSETIHSETLPDLPLPTITLSDSPEFSDLPTPSDSQYFNLTEKSMKKIILSLNPATQDLNFAYKLIKRLKFFQLFPKEICINLLSKAKYVFYPQGAVIFREGDFADSIYVILLGSVSVEQYYKGMSFVVNSRYDGETVGEYAMIRGNVDINEAKRSATCFVGEATHLLKIMSFDYVQVTSAISDNESAVLHFLSTHLLFRHIPPVELAYLANSLRPEKFFFESQVLGIGEIPKGLHIIYQGRLTAIYKRKTMDFPPKYFFGQRIIVGESTESRCRVISNAVDSLVLILRPSHLDLISRPFRERTLSILLGYIDSDL